MARRNVRQEHQILGELLHWGSSHNNIRTIVINGSRGDPSRTPDELSDYDAAVIVQDLDPMQIDSWIRQFGEIMVRWPLYPQPTLSPAWITQLVLFADGVRIDFQFTTPDVREIECAAPYHCVLMDKDDVTGSLTRLPIDGTTIDPPTAADFADRINAFWWDVPYVAKALRRGEIDYARFIMEGDLRFNKLHPLIRWHIGWQHGPNTDVGIFGRWFSSYLEPDLWQRYLETYSGPDPHDQWRAMFAMTEFVDLLGKRIADNLNLSYPESVASSVTSYLHSIERGRSDRNN